MAGSDDSSLDLNLPWGRPSPGVSPPERDGPGRRRHDAPEPLRAGPVGQPVDASYGLAADDEVTAAPAGAPNGQPEAVRSVHLHVLEARLERLQREFAARLDPLEERALIRDSALEARLDKFEAGIEASHAAIIKSVGMMAGQIVVRLEDDRADFSAALQARHEELMARLDAVRATTLAAVRDLAKMVDPGVAPVERNRPSDSKS